MRRFLAAIVVAFAKLVTLPLGTTRRRDARIMVRDRLAPTYPVSTKHGDLVFDASFRWSLRSADVFPRWEPETQEWIDEFPEGACFWDIGANIGMFSLYAALRPEVRVLAFEPAGITYAVLNRNIGLNDMEDRIAGYCIAFSEETKLDKFNMPFANAGFFGTEINWLDEVMEMKFRQGCVGFSIDDFVSTFAPPLPAHIKIDVDGIEAGILRGGKENSLLALCSFDERGNTRRYGVAEKPRDRHVNGRIGLSNRAPKCLRSPPMSSSTESPYNAAICLQILR